MKQRLGIACALLGGPELLFLDEPTNGMDPAGMAEVRELIRSLGDGDRTVLLSSHLLCMGWSKSATVLRSSPGESLSPRGPFRTCFNPTKG